MAYTNVWDETQPPDSQQANLLGLDVRNTKLDLRQRLESIFGAGIFSTDPVTITSLTFNGNLANPGASTPVIYNQSGVGPTISGNQFQVRTGAVPTQRLNIDASGNVVLSNSLAVNSGGIALGNNTDKITFGSGPTGYRIRPGTGAPVAFEFVAADESAYVPIRAGVIYSTGGLQVTGAVQSVFAGSVSLQGTLIVDGASSTTRAIRYTTGGSLRWQAQTTNTAEGGSNSGSDYAISRYSDTGVFLDNPIVISRATGEIDIVDTLVVTKQGLGAAAIFEIRSDAGQARQFTFRTGVSARWQIQVTSSAESGGNVGSDFSLNRYDDTGAFLSSPIVITRSSGLIAIGSQVTVSVSTAVPLELKSLSTSNNRILRLTNTEASGKQWDLIVQSVAQGSGFIIYDNTDSVTGLTILPSGAVLLGGNVTGTYSLAIDRNDVAQNNGMILLKRQTVAKFSIGLNANDKFTIFDSGTTNLVVVDSGGTMQAANVIDAINGFRCNGSAPSGQFLRGNGASAVFSAIQASDLPSPLNPTSFQVNSGATVSRLLSASVTWQPNGGVGLAANGGNASTTVTVTGAQVGDAVMWANAWLADDTRYVVTAYVSALNTVTLNIVNASSSLGNAPSSRTIKVWVIG